VAYQKVLSGVDGSDTALESLRYAAQIAKAEGADLLILCVYRPVDPRTIQQWKSEASSDLYWKITDHAVADAALEKAERVARAEGVEAQTIKEVGDPSDIVVAVAQREAVDLIVVGNRGMSGGKRFILGSVPNNVSHHSPCDLLIVHTTPT
jgi:nucleotide-binding universal stress UspA family protein